MCAAVDLQENIEPNASLLRSPVKRDDRIVVIRKQIQFDSSSLNRYRIVKFAVFDREGIGDIVETVFRKSPCFSQSRSSDRTIVAVGLYPRNLDAFVGLYMRTKSDIVSPCD